MLDNINFADPVVKVISVLLGIVVLIAGRRLFWLTVAGVGFVIGLTLAFTFLEDQPIWLMVLAALIAGGVGALLAILLQKIAVGLAGFLLGGYVSVWLLPQLNVDLSQWDWLVFIIGGVIGSILMAWVFDYALIVLSSLVGATMILQVANFRPEITLVIFLVLLLVGVVIQFRTMHPQATSSHRSRRRY